MKKVESIPICEFLNCKRHLIDILKHRQSLSLCTLQSETKKSNNEVRQNVVKCYNKRFKCHNEMQRKMIIFSRRKANSMEKVVLEMGIKYSRSEYKR